MLCRSQKGGDVLVRNTIELVYLILHKRNERTDHQCHTLSVQGRQLITNGLSRTCARGWVQVSQSVMKKLKNYGVSCSVFVGWLVTHQWPKRLRRRGHSRPLRQPAFGPDETRKIQNIVEGIPLGTHYFVVGDEGGRLEISWRAWLGA
jgi:hypothetical protein